LEEQFPVEEAILLGKDDLRDSLAKRLLKVVPPGEEDEENDPKGSTTVGGPINKNLNIPKC
jgi:hypothetical protein